jgi:hypothetical protein
MLSTTADTRAEQIYRVSGWIEVGSDAVGDLLFQKHLVLLSQKAAGQQ